VSARLGTRLLPVVPMLWKDPLSNHRALVGTAAGMSHYNRVAVRHRRRRRTERRSGDQRRGDSPARRWDEERRVVAEHAARRDVEEDSSQAADPGDATEEAHEA